MGIKTLAAAVVVAGLCASAAVAAPPPGKGKPGTTTTGATTTTTTTTTTPSHGKKPPATGANCRPKVSIVLTGKLAADGAAAPSSLSVTVSGSNHAGKAYKTGTQPVSIAITTATKISRHGKHDPTLLKTGDRVNVQAQVCKADLAKGATPALTATRLTASPAKSGGDTTTTATTGSGG